MSTIKGYKVFDPDFTCKGYQFKENSRFKHNGKLEICESGFHFCTSAGDCFRYYTFTPENIVCEVEAMGEVQTKEGDSKHATDDIFVGRRLTWEEVLKVANSGSNNTGHSNSGDRNSGNRNSGDSNSGNWNSGNWNSGDRNSGNWNSGDSNSGNCNSGNCNSGNWNSGNWNSGDRNSGDSNSGYRNSGAFCTESNPVLFLFDKPTNILVKDWEKSEACQMMYSIEPTIWVPSSIMTDEEKKNNPKWETTEGYFKKISMKETWANFWGNLSDEKKNVFLTLPNFDKEKFKEITGLTV